MIEADKTLHCAYKDLQRIKWNDFRKVGLDETYFDYYYAEATLYIIRDRITLEYFFVEANSPLQAFEKYKEALDN